MTLLYWKVMPANPCGKTVNFAAPNIYIYIYIYLRKFIPNENREIYFSFLNIIIDEIDKFLRQFLGILRKLSWVWGNGQAVMKVEFIFEGIFTFKVNSLCEMRPFIPSFLRKWSLIDSIIHKVNSLLWMSAAHPIFKWNFSLFQWNFSLSKWIHFINWGSLRGEAPSSPEVDL